MALANESKEVIVLKTQKKDFTYVMKSLLAGGVAGMCSKTTVAPLDRIKILLQAHNKHYASFGVFSGLAEIVKRESFAALYKGNGAQMVRVFPYAAIQFTSFEFYKTLLGSILGKGSHIGKFMSGSLAGVTAVTFTYPLDTIRARLAFQVTGEHVYNGIAHTAKSIVQKEGGIKALYRGFVPTLCGMVPYAGLTFFCFETIKKFFLKTLPLIFSKSSSKDSGGVVLTVPAKLVCGGLSGAFAQCVSYPLDVTRRRMQLAKMDPATGKFGHGMFKTLITVYKVDGVVNGLYRGMSINFLRAVPMVAVSFSTYELMKQTLELDTGVDS
ncbi:solute carrier family 25 member 16-like [Adelges cooleyi]|uniref:solute carrier family 25 member 16-like n=1 Tax=Adelges cooleyi TaxID=133065 RepID=UPI00217F6534|nr:solute carrier family 25 member 16-like [Adelges cooleyi]